ncbi:MAG TPA: general secretion pathway protein GspB [Candidatus Methylomirabilis sp.]|nr:general secretion pathway protein GspB [Candidatus Methylomirabilis sp.]
MRLDVFVYTGVKADRMVVINGRRYAEGQYVDGVYLLEEITSEGAVLSYQGERALLRP